MATRSRSRPDADLQRLRDRLQAGEVPPFCLLHGEDRHRKDRVVEAIVDRVLGDRREMGLLRFDGQQHALADVLQACLSLPMFATAQVVVVRHADEMLRDADAQDHLLAYAGSPSPGTTLVMDADQLDGRRKWVKELQGRGFVYHVPLPAGRDLNRWCHRLAREQGLTLTEEQVGRLLDLVGDDLEMLRQELARLAMAVEAEPDGSVSAVLDQVIARRQVDVFALVRLLRPGKVTEALRQWHRFLAEGRDVMELAPLVAWRIRQLCSVLELQDRGLAPGDIAGLLGVSPYAVREVGQGARDWDRDRRRAALAACRDLELDVKAGRMEPVQAMERFILRLAGK